MPNRFQIPAHEEPTPEMIEWLHENTEDWTGDESGIVLIHNDGTEETGEPGDWVVRDNQGRYSIERQAMRHVVNSSMIKAIEETGRGTMIIEFTQRGKYEYFDVPSSVIREFVEAPSVGKFFNENIRGQYREEYRS